jgi:hypothetical protein
MLVSTLFQLSSIAFWRLSAHAVPVHDPHPDHGRAVSVVVYRYPADLTFGPGYFAWHSYNEPDESHGGSS